MSDAALALLEGRAKGASSAPKQSAADLLAERASGKTFDLPKDASKSAPPGGYSSPYAYYTPEVQRNVGNTGEGLQPLMHAPGAAASGINEGSAYLLGKFADTAQDVIDIGGSAYSAARSAFTGEDPNELYQPPDRSQLPLTGAWLSKKLDSTPMGNITQNPHPEEMSSRLIHSAAAGVPGGLAGGGGVAPIVSGAAGGAASAVGGELGLDPASQAAMSMLAGAGASKIAERMQAEPPKAVPNVVEETQAKLNEAASKQSMGAAGAAVDLKSLSPELRADVQKAVQQTGGAVNPDAMARSVQADSLPVPVRLTPGQKLGDPRLISEERNGRGETPGVVEGFAEQNKALVKNMQVLRDTSGENVFSTRPDQHADTLISRYEKIHEEAQAETSAKYQAMRDAAGGEFPIDTPTLLTNVRGALKKDMSSSKAPSDVMTALEEHAASGKMSLEEYEAVRSKLAMIQRASSDGQERHAAGIIRRQIEELPLAPQAAGLKGLADAARASARADFQRQEADPAYKAVVEGKAVPDKFIHKYVIGGHRDNVAKLSEAMKGDPTATQTLEVAVLDHLRDSAGIDPQYNGNFRSHDYNKEFRNLAPKLNSLVSQKTAETLQNIGDVARYSQLQPEGHYVNNSNTSVAQRAASHAADVAEGMANLKAGVVPVGSWVRKNITDRQGRKEAQKMFAPGSGLTNLSDLSKMGKK